MVDIYNEFEKICNKITLTGSKCDAIISVYEDSESYKKLISRLVADNINFGMSETREYTTREMNEAEYFCMRLVWPWIKERKSPERFGTQYKDSDKYLCEEKQSSDLFVPKIKTQKYKICTTFPGIVINEDLTQALLEYSLNGYEFKNVRDSQTKEIIKLKQLVITNKLGEISSETKCHRIYNSDLGIESVDIRGEIIYKKAELNNTCDFNITCEKFIQDVEGKFSVCLPYIIVSKKFRDICKVNRVKSAIFEPICIVE